MSSPFQKTVDLWQENGYECLGLLGRGSFGHVYEMKNQEFEKSLAMKVCLHKKVSTGETNLWSLLNDEHIVPLILSGHIPSIGTWIFFMPKYKTNLGQRMKELEFQNDINGFKRGKSYLSDVIHGLSYLHKNGI